MRIASVVALLSAALPALAINLPLKTSSRWILDADDQRVKLRCVNWAGHLEVNTPEGLNKQSVDYIADFVAAQGFNCVRLTYSIDHALGPDVPLSQSFTNAASAASVDVNAMNAMFAQIAEKNPALANGTTRDAYAAVIAALWKRGVMTILDNHVSKASWCCKYIYIIFVPWVLKGYNFSDVGGICSLALRNIKSERKQKKKRTKMLTR